MGYQPLNIPLDNFAKLEKDIQTQHLHFPIFSGRSFGSHNLKIWITGEPYLKSCRKIITQQQLVSGNKESGLGFNLNDDKSPEFKQWWILHTICNCILFPLNSRHIVDCQSVLVTDQWRCTTVRDLKKKTWQWLCKYNHWYKNISKMFKSSGVVIQEN